MMGKKPSTTKKDDKTLDTIASAEDNVRERNYKAIQKHGERLKSEVL